MANEKEEIIILERNGETREVTKREFADIKFEKYGWKVVSGDAPKDHLKIVEGGKAADVKGIHSSKYTDNNMMRGKLKKALQGKTAEEINAAFEGEGREKFVALKEELLAALAPKPILSTDYADDEKGIAELKAALEGKTAEEINAAFETETREPLLALWVELVKV